MKIQFQNGLKIYQFFNLGQKKERNQICLSWLAFRGEERLS